ncbi:MAG: hypothetical protein C0478_12405 [Planctomyces sp.]|nr:hypothetical protein [Planctomyces sp.]
MSPALDLLLIINIGWPLLVLVAWLGAAPAQEDWQFLQVYFLTTPHRWLTLGLVWGDARRRQTQGTLYLGILLAAILVCGLVQAGTGALTCLVAVDFLWNTWHFAAQNHGIYRLYTGKIHPATDATERLLRVLIRGSIIYVVLRASGWLRAPDTALLTILDTACGTILIALLLVAFVRFRSSRAGSLYLASVVLLYGAWLLAEVLGERSLILPLATASAWFHASEYLAVCSWSVQKQAGRQTTPAQLSTAGWIYRLAPLWASTMLIYILVVGVGSWYLNRQIAELWLAMNLVAAFLHYAYDGLIWRRSNTQTAVAVQ